MKMDYLEKLKLYLPMVGTTKKYKGYYFKIYDCLVILVCGCLCGLGNLKQIYRYAKNRVTKQMLRQVFNIRKIPCYSQFTNIMSIIDNTQLEEAFRAWTQWIIYDLQGKTVSFDGKTIKTTCNMKKYAQPVHIISAHVSELGITIGQLSVKSKSNEIPAVQDLIKTLNLKGCVVVADALNTQKETVSAIIEKEADYVLLVKENQGNLYKEIKEMYDYVLNDKVERNQRNYEYTKMVENNHGRNEIRESYVITQIDWLQEKNKWKKLSCIGLIRNTFIENGEKNIQVRYYISSKKLTSKELIYYTRNEWKIESMHWLLDVNLKEDLTKLREENAQKNLNILRKIALNSMKLYKKNNKIKDSISGLMQDCLMDPEVLIEVLRNIS